MELEELKQKWEVLSEEVDKQKITTKNILDNAIKSKAKSISKNLSEYVAIAAVCMPLFIMFSVVGEFDLMPSYIWLMFAGGMLFELLFNLYLISLVKKMKSYTSNIQEIEYTLIKYRRWYDWSNIIGIIFIVIIFAFLFTEGDNFYFWILPLILGIGLGLILMMRDYRKMRELKVRIKEYKEFIKE